MRISDWSSDVCSSDPSRCQLPDSGDHRCIHVFHAADAGRCGWQGWGDEFRQEQGAPAFRRSGDRKDVVEGKSVAVSVDLGGSRSIKKTKEVYSNTSIKPDD